MVKTPMSQQPPYRELRKTLDGFARLRRPDGAAIQAAAAVTAALRDFSAIERAIVQHRLEVEFPSGNVRTFESVEAMRGEQQVITREVQPQLALIDARVKAAATRRVIKSPFMN